MALNRRYVRLSLLATFSGLGAFKWLEPRLRRWFLVGVLLYGFLMGVAMDFLPEDAERVTIVLLVAGVMTVPFIFYDLVLGYLLLERRDMEGDLAVAARIQSGLFPDRLPVSNRADWAGFNRAAKSVGGDYWDVMERGPGRTLFLVADISGKGVPAALLMSGLRAQLHLLIAGGDGVGEIARRLNRGFHAETAPTEFATIFLGELDEAAGTLEYVNAGHPEALLVRAGGAVESLGEGGPPVGMLPDTDYRSGRAGWSAGDRLVVFSDGALDVAVGSRGPLEPEELVPVARQAGPGATALVDALQRFVRSHERGEPEDDITILVCEFR